MAHPHLVHLTAILTLALAAPLQGQAWTRDWPQSGDAVRVTASAPPFDRARMTFQRQTNDTLIFSRTAGLSRQRVETAVALRDISRLEMPGIPKSQYRRGVQGAITGLVIGGLAVGSAMYFTTDFSCHETDTCPEYGAPEFEQKVRGVVGFLGGGLLGSVVGFSIGNRHAHETWRIVR